MAEICTYWVQCRATMYSVEPQYAPYTMCSIEPQYAPYTMHRGAYCVGYHQIGSILCRVCMIPTQYAPWLISFNTNTIYLCRVESGLRVWVWGWG